MDVQKGLITRFGEWWDQQQVYRCQTTAVRPYRRFGGWLPSRGSFIFTLLMIGLLLWAQTAGALPLSGYLNAPDAPSTGTIAYQGRLADANGNPLTSTVNMEFRLYNAATGSAPLWSELWTGSNAVQVSDGLFNVMLGSLTPIPQNIVTGNGSLWLGITAGTDNEMMPRVQLGSVPFAVQALTVPDESVTTAKISDGAVTQAKLGTDVSLVPPDASITTAMIADGAVTQVKAPSLVRSANGDNQIIRSGSTVVTTDTNGEVCVPLGYWFPNRVTSFVALNGDIYWNTAVILGTLSVEQYVVRSCVTLRTSAANSTMRINWIAVGY